LTESEAKNFIRDLIIAYPQVDEVAKFNSPDLAATHRVWVRMLSKYSDAECRSVLDGWIDGTLKAPDKVDMKVPIETIRSIVSKLRSDAARKGASQQLCKPVYRDALDVPGVAAAFKRGYEIKKAVMNGTLAEADAREAIRKIVDEVK